MKLRILDNSLRLRLSRSEVTTLGRDGQVRSHTVFPGGRSLSCVLESSPASVTPTAMISNNVVTVQLPESAVLPWVASEQVSIEGEQALEDGSCLKLLVEKDFACLTPRAGEDESDLFPHPQADGC